jgi:hypothetical protein
MYQKSESTTMTTLLDEGRDNQGHNPFVILRKWSYLYEVTSGFEEGYSRGAVDTVLRYGITGDYGQDQPEEEHIEVLDHYDTDLERVRYALAKYDEMVEKVAAMREAEAQERESNQKGEEIPF